MDISAWRKSLEEQYGPRYHAALVRGLEKFCAHVLGEAQQLCPVETGALKSSDAQDPPVSTVQEISITFGFNTEYAAAVHEVLESKRGNPINHPQGQAKFLETAMQANATLMIQFIEAELAREFG